VDLSVWREDGLAPPPSPPVECFVKKTNNPHVIVLTSIDLNCSVEVRSYEELFDFSSDMLGLLKAAVIAAGVVPPWTEKHSENTEKHRENTEKHREKIQKDKTEKHRENTEKDRKNTEKDSENTGEKRAVFVGGFSLVSRVRNIPKGSRLAVSTTLLACAIAVLMRATGQAEQTGELREETKRLVCSR
jgi:hypothetical protein